MVIGFVLILNKTFLNYQSGGRKGLSKLTPSLPFGFEKNLSLHISPGQSFVVFSLPAFPHCILLPIII